MGVAGYSKMSPYRPLGTNLNFSQSSKTVCTPVSTADPSESSAHRISVDCPSVPLRIPLGTGTRSETCNPYPKSGCRIDEVLVDPMNVTCPANHDCLVRLDQTEEECTQFVQKIQTKLPSMTEVESQHWSYSQTKGDSLDAIASACIVELPHSTDEAAVQCYGNENTTWDGYHDECVCNPGYVSSNGSTTCEKFYTDQSTEQLLDYYPDPCVLGNACVSAACPANKIPTVDHTRCVSIDTATNVEKVAAGYTSYLCLGKSLNFSADCSCSDLDKPVGPLQNRPQCSGDWWEMDSCDTKFKGGECWKDNPGSPDPCKPGPGQVEWCTQQAAIGFPTDVGCDTNPTTKKPWCSPEHEATNYRPLIMLAGILGDFL